MQSKTQQFELQEIKEYLDFLSQYSLKYTLIITTTILCITILCLVYTYKNKHTKIQNSPDKKTKKILILITIRTILLSLTIIAAMFLSQEVKLYKIAKQHGMETNDTAKISEIYQAIETLPIESKLPETKDLKNKLIIYYKFGCHDCESIHNKLYNIIKNYDNVYIVYTRSKQGKQLRETFPVKKVPSGLYIQSDGTPVTLPLYDKNSDGTAVINSTNINTLLTLLEAKS